MNIYLYNSLTRRKEIFEPLKVGEVSLYSCGPTVYDRVHIGNLRAFIVADLLQRVLRYIGGYKVRWVMNITDIDDKIIARAQTKYSNKRLAEGVRRLAKTFEAKFIADLSAVGVHLEDLYARPHATEFIPQMQAMIRALVNDGIAYTVDGSIYFSLERYQQSGHKYGRFVQLDHVGYSRIDDQDQKMGVGDFALWKAAKPGEPSWNFELDGRQYPGRPGWHIECSAMSTDLLGTEFDIHTGGIDLKFPHHENELAQCGGRLARYWLHNEFLTVGDEKMAKSSGNFRTLDDIEHGLAFRLLVLSAHYRSPMDGSDEALVAAGKRWRALREWTSRVMNNVSMVDEDYIGELRRRFDEAIADDLNTPQALAVVAEAERSQMYSEAMLAFIDHIDAVLGLGLVQDQPRLRNKSEVVELLHDRELARENKAFDQSDNLRDELASIGVGVEDTADGQVIWQREA